MDDPILEKKLKKMFECRAEEFPNESVREARVRKNVYEQIERKGYHMKNIFMKKMIVIAATLCVLGSMTVFAIGKITGVRAGSSLLDEVHTYEQARELQKEYGPKINFPEKFSNGYEFESAVPVHFETQDKDGNTVGSGTHLSVTYEKSGMEDIIFSEEVAMDSESSPSEIKVCEDGSELRFYKTVNKFVPENYELTDEDKKAQKEGQFNLSYGSDEIEIMISYMVEWDIDGQRYSLFKFGDELSMDELFEMAEEMMNQH